MGLLGPGGVHAHSDHLVGLVRMLPPDVRICLHLFSDGRDTDRKSFLEYLESLQRDLDMDRMTVASISGRYFAMDRDTNWERTERAFRAVMGTSEAIGTDPAEWVRDQYAHDVTDEFFPPVRFAGSEPIGAGEAVVFFNFRSDRAKQLARAFSDAKFDGFSRSVPENLLFATMTRYYPEFSGKVFLEDTKRDDFL
jgi:2,3-bisphosphoglycerate-independent phosphoglycerate mutase